MSEEHDDRLVRLGVLRDRATRGTTQDSDLLEVLDIADASVKDTALARSRTKERDGWKALIAENTTHLANAIVVLQQAEPHLAALAANAKAKTAFYQALRDKKVLLTLAFLIFLLVGGLAGFLSFKAVNINQLVPGGGSGETLPAPGLGEERP
jgi:hypothetical protein